MRQISIELTEYCNFQCMHCYLKMRKEECRRMSFSYFCYLLRWAKENNVLFLSLTGGEVFLCSEFCKFYEEAVKEGFVVSVLTNGSLLNEGILKSFCRYSPQVVEVSLYGMTDATYQKMTGRKEICKKVLLNIQHLHACGIPVVAKYVTTSINYEELDEFDKWTNQYSIPNIITIANLPLRENKQFLLIDHSFRISHKQLSEMVRKYPEKISVLRKDLHTTCDLGEYLHFSSSGLIYGCPALFLRPQQLTNNSSWEDIVANYLELKKEYRFCPAWEQIESSDEIAKFLYGAI